MAFPRHPLTALATGEAWAHSQPQVRKAVSSLTSTSDGVMAFADGVKAMKAPDLRSAEGRPPPRPVSLEATLTLTEYVAC